MRPHVYHGPWWCPVCGRATIDSYRCSNGSCAVDLAGEKLERIVPGEPVPPEIREAQAYHKRRLHHRQQQHDTQA